MCSLAAAVHHLNAVLERLRMEAAATWHTVMWVIRACPTEFHRYLKCAWELEQPKLVENWLSINSALVSADAQATAAAKVRHMGSSQPGHQMRSVRTFRRCCTTRHALLQLISSLETNCQLLMLPMAVGHAPSRSASSYTSIRPS